MVRLTCLSLDLHTASWNAGAEDLGKLPLAETGIINSDSYSTPASQSDSQDYWYMNSSSSSNTFNPFHSHLDYDYELAAINN